MGTAMGMLQQKLEMDEFHIGICSSHETKHWYLAWVARRLHSDSEALRTTRSLMAEFTTEAHLEG